MTVTSTVAAPVAARSAGTVRFRIYRYDPEKDAKPRLQDLEVRLHANDKMLLDALMRIKADVDDSLSLSLIHI